MKLFYFAALATGVVAVLAHQESASSDQGASPAKNIRLARRSDSDIDTELDKLEATPQKVGAQRGEADGVEQVEEISQSDIDAVEKMIEAAIGQVSDLDQTEFERAERLVGAAARHEVEGQLAEAEADLNEAWREVLNSAFNKFLDGATYQDHLAEAGQKLERCREEVARLKTLLRSLQ